ncbi:MAG: hypothetical protein ICV83_04920 [Cytophagales bacterium]|nr:hypothetical protein [Cytophagales bacterium]
MITLTQFETLSTDAQAAYTWQHGNYLMSRLTAHLVVNLFNVNNFFVEVTSDARLHYIHAVAHFMTPTALHAGYQDSISLHGLVTDLLPVMPAVKDPAFGNHPAADALPAWDENPVFVHYGAGRS